MNCYKPDNITAYKSYPFGSLMPNRSFSSSDYRYGFQGQEKENDVVGEGLVYTYRIDDARIGRFLSIDPLTSKYPHYTPYSFSGNKVIHSVELEGLEEHVLSGNEKDGFSLNYDWDAEPLENGQVYYNGEATDIAGLSKKYDIPLFKPISYPTEKLGETGYYEFRDEDLTTRAGLAGRKVEDDQYYLNYGDVNIRLFKGETYAKVSAKGRSFITQAAKNLQQLIENKLSENGAAEFEIGSKFNGFAFKTHIPAYKDAGFLGLDFLDKTYIGLTPPISHITSDEGIQQVRLMMTQQMKYYKENPEDLYIHLLKYTYQKYEIQKAIGEKAVKEIFYGK